jgi:predicted PurR-regulated permease PerM
VSAPAARPPRIQIPRWIQLVGLPLLLLFAWVLARAAGHAVFLFLVAALIALLLDPIVRTLGAFRVRRGIAVALVYISLAGALIIIVIAVTTVVVGQTRTAADRFNAYFTDQHGRSHQTSADRDVDRLQEWLNTHHLGSIKVQASGHRIDKRIRDRDVGR